MTPTPLKLAAALLMAAIACSPAPAGAEVTYIESEAAVPGMEKRPGPKDKSAAPARTRRSGAGGHIPPVDRICRGRNPPGADSSLQGDGPINASCSGITIEVVTPDGLELQLEKASATQEINGPGPVNYQYFLVNSGLMPLTGIQIADDHVDAQPICPVTNLQPMSSTVCEATYTVTPADFAAGGSPIPGSGFLQNVVTVFTNEGISATAGLFIPYSVQADPLVLSPASPSLGTAVQGRSQQFTFTASGGTPPYEFTASGAPPGMTVQQSGASMTLSGAPQVTGDFAIGVALSDSSVPQNTVERNYSLSVVSPLNLLPPSMPLPSAVVGQPYEFFFTISGGAAPYEFSADGVPPGLNLARFGNQLRLSGTSAQIGEFTLSLAVADSSTPAQLAAQTYTLEVLQDLSISPVDPLLPDAVAGQAYEFMFTISGGVPPFEFTASGTPAGFGFALTERQLIFSGSGVETGEFSIDLALSDSSTPSQSVAQAYSLRVVPLLRLLPADPVLPLAQAGEPYQFSFVAEGGLAPVSIGGDGAPPGMNFAIVSGQLVLSGVPGEIGEYAITVSAQDSASPLQMIVREYSLSVVLKLEIDPQLLPRATTGQDYLAVLSVRNGVPPYEIEAADLPPGLSMNSNAITGVPSQAGAFELTALAIDASGNTGSRDYVLQVGSSSDVTIGGSLPNAYLNTAYGYQLPAVGAPTPVIWSGGSGLPPGIELVDTGLVNGLAQQTGSFSFDATASSADGQVRSGQFDIVVLPPDLLTAEPDFPPALTGVHYRSPTAVRGGTPPYDCAIIGGSVPPGLGLTGCDEGIEGTPTSAGSFPFSLGVLDSSVPELAVELDGIVQVADSTPIEDDLPPDIEYRPPFKVPVPQLAVEGPGEAFPDESLQQLAVDEWGNRYVAGFSFNGSDYDIRVLKFSARGVLLWHQRYDSGSHDYGYGITVAASEQAVYASGYSLVGNRYEAVLIRYDLVGVQQWVVHYGADSQAVALYGLDADEGGVYAVGERYNGLNFDAVVVRYSHGGNLVWETVRPSQQTRTGYAAVRTDCSAGPCLLIGGAEGETNRSGWIEQVDPASGAASTLALVSAAPVLALQATQGRLVAGGSTSVDDWVITAFDAGGQVEWSTTESAGHRLRGLVLDRDGYLYAAGSGSSGGDAMVALISPSGDVIGIAHFDEGASESFHAIGIGPEGLVTAAGQRTEAEGNRFLLVNFNTGKAH